MSNQTSGLVAVWVAGGLLVAVGAYTMIPPPKATAPVQTIKDIMDSTVDPAGDFLFESIQDIADDKGVRRKQPTTDADWAAVRKRLMDLYDAPTALTAPGRKAAGPDDRSAAPGVENEPWETQVLLDSQHPILVQKAEALKQAAALGLKAADARDVDGLFKAIVTIDHACESCHLHFWYPRDKRAQAAAREEGVE